MLNRKDTSRQSGFTPAVLVILSALGIIIYVLVSSTLPFKDKLFALLYPKPSSHAATKSKLGMQTQWQKPGTMAFIEAAKPVVVKLMGGFNYAAEIKQKSPNSFIVGRIWEQKQPLDGVAETRAQEWFNRNRTTLQTPSIDCWEGYNEPLTNTTEIMQWYSRFEIKRMQLLESIGKKACIGNFSVANPDYSLWQDFSNAVNYATGHGHFLGLHEYGPTTMGDRSDDFSLRHRNVYNNNHFTLPLIISETGIDSGGCDNCTTPQNGCGWRGHTNATDYFNQLKWYDNELQQDTYVKGATIFSYGLYNWCSFEIYPELVGIDGRSGPLTAYIRGGPVPTPTPTPSPTPRPTPIPCDPAKVSMKASPNPAIISSSSTITFSVSGTQGSTFLNDVWSGGVNCTGGFWGSRTCSAVSAGNFSWTHYWKNCAPGNCSVTSPQCSKQIPFAIVSPTPTPKSCPQVVTYARNPLTGECQQFLSPCRIPLNWEIVSSCKITIF